MCALGLLVTLTICLPLCYLITRGLVTDPFLAVLESQGSIFSLGDVATIRQASAVEHAMELFKQGDTNGDGKLSVQVGKSRMES